MVNQRTYSTATARPWGYSCEVAFDYYVFLLLLFSHFKATPRHDLHKSPSNSETFLALSSMKKFFEAGSFFPLRENYFLSINGEKRLIFDVRRHSWLTAWYSFPFSRQTEAWALCTDKDKGTSWDLNKSHKCVRSQVFFFSLFRASFFLMSQTKI